MFPAPQQMLMFFSELIAEGGVAEGTIQKYSILRIYETWGKDY
jgi:hypothetical protein